MQRFRFLIAVPIAALLVLSGYGASSLLAGASSTPVSYFACLNAGTLTKVGTKSPKCPSGAKVITWNQVGPSGAPGAKGDAGAPGAKGDTGAPGVKGDIGTKGDTGAPGAKGDAGVQGDTGAKGDTGAPGAKGDTGAPGTPGPNASTSLWAAPSGCTPYGGYEACSITSTLHLAEGSYVIDNFWKMAGGGIGSGIIAGCVDGFIFSTSGEASISAFPSSTGTYGPNVPQIATVGSGGGWLTLRCQTAALNTPLPSGSIGIAMQATPTTVQ